MRLQASVQPRISPTPSVKVQARAMLFSLSQEELDKEILWKLSCNPFLKRATFSNFSGDDLLAQLANPPPTLAENLHEQLLLTHAHERTQLAALYLIDELDDNGYLPLDLVDIYEALQIKDLTFTDFEKALAVIHTLEPVGVGARNLQECLLLQWQDVPDQHRDKALAYHIIHGYLHLIAIEDYAQLSRALDCDYAALRRAIALIKQFNPKPGSEYQKALPTPSPDLIATKTSSGWIVKTNEKDGLHAALYLQDANGFSVPDSSIFKTSATWFLKCLAERAVVLQRVAQFLVEHQQDFLDNGREHMKPLGLQDIAQVTGLHVSTISRICSKKYMQTPRGLFELKSFFAHSVDSSLSNQAVMHHIKSLISQEDFKIPLTDAKIVLKLKEKSISISRRTVCKYRQALHVDSAFKRRA